MEHGTDRPTTDQGVNAARDRLKALLAMPDERPDSWEAAHVIALEGQLRAVLSLLDDDGEQR